MIRQFSTKPLHLAAEQEIFNTFLNVELTLVHISNGITGFEIRLTSIITDLCAASKRI